MMVPTTQPWKTMDEFVKAIQTDPSSISFGMIGGTGIPDVLVYQLKAALKAKGVDASKTRMVTYKGGGELVPAVAGGHVSAAFVSPGEMIAMLSAGKIRVLAVTAPTGKRYKGWPDVPTMAEAGFPTVDTYFWVGLGGAPGLPANIVKILDNAVRSHQRSRTRPCGCGRVRQIGTQHRLSVWGRIQEVCARRGGTRQGRSK
jgi:tripartite-type tricarboxylate transporter receptor subunit TctC